MAESMDVMAEEEVRRYILQLINEGMTPYKELVETVLDYLAGEYEAEVITECVNRLAPLLYDCRLEEQSMWPLETDCDRLDRAFALLEKKGIVARQDFTCCQTCGHSEIWDEISEAARKRDIIGYTFYHHQDLESMADGGACYLAYGAKADDENEALKVGNIICQTLREEGFNVQWDGSLNTRILIKDIDWKMRLEPRA